MRTASSSQVSQGLIEFSSLTLKYRIAAYQNPKSKCAVEKSRLSFFHLSRCRAIDKIKWAWARSQCIRDNNRCRNIGWLTRSSKQMKILVIWARTVVFAPIKSHGNGAKPNKIFPINSQHLYSPHDQKHTAFAFPPPFVQSQFVEIVPWSQRTAPAFYISIACLMFYICIYILYVEKFIHANAHNCDNFSQRWSKTGAPALPIERSLQIFI